MDYIELLEDGGSIVSDEDLSSGITDHLVHTSWTKAGSDAVGNGWMSRLVPLAAWMLVSLISLDFSFLL
jgi:hypothetical protein